MRRILIALLASLIVLLTFAAVSAQQDTTDILIWAGGNFENLIWLDTMSAAPGQTIDIPIWFYGHDENVTVLEMYYPLGINNGYIDSFNTLNCIWHYPLTIWDIRGFTDINEDWQIDGSGNTWDSYLFWGMMESPPPYEWNPLVTNPGDPPSEIITFSVHVRDDLEPGDEIVNDAIGPGYDPYAYGISFWGPDADHYTYMAYFSPFKFIRIYYTPGDANMLTGIWPPQVIGSDVTYLVNYFRGANEPCLLQGFYCAADINGDCMVIGSDVTRLVNYFRGTAELSFCPDYPPAWPTVDDIPEEMPSGWPGCE